MGYLFWFDLGFSGLCYFLMWISGVPKVYLVLFWLIRGFSGLFFLRMSGVLKVYLVVLDKTTVMYTGFDSISLRRLPTDDRARAVVLATLVLIIKKRVLCWWLNYFWVRTRRRFSCFVFPCHRGMLDLLD